MQFLLLNANEIVHTLLAVAIVLIGFAFLRHVRQ